MKITNGLFMVIYRENIKLTEREENVATEKKSFSFFLIVGE